MTRGNKIFGIYKNFFGSLNAKNLGYVGQNTSKLLAVKLWKWFNFALDQTRPNAIANNLGGMAEAADFFLRTPTLKARNFAALWPRDPKFSAYKD